MGKRGPKPKKIIDETWRPNLAYAIGLIATDGCLSKDGLLIDLTSKDKEQLENFSKCLDIKFTIGEKFGKNKVKCLRIQFKNKIFYNFLLSVGLTPAKSKTLGEVYIPKEYFFDFLRGCFDGDGSFYSYWDKRWKSSFMFYLEFISSSKKHINWLRSELQNRLGVLGHIGNDSNKATFQLKYAKKEAVEIINKMYYNSKVVCLSRKSIKIKNALDVENKQQSEYRLRGWRKW